MVADADTRDFAQAADCQRATHIRCESAGVVILQVVVRVVERGGLVLCEKSGQEGTTRGVD